MKTVAQHDREKILSIMDRIAFFDQFSTFEKNDLVEFHTHFFVFDAGEYLIREKETETFFFILLAGSVNVTVGTPEKSIDRLEPGEIFGEMSFLAGTPRTTNVAAEEMVIAIRVDRDMMDRLPVALREKIKDRIIHKLVLRLDRMNRRFVENHGE
ncbi:MAG: cyclic nucleotide-binding domain-containing protein [Desulfobacterales bacterium]|nr:cyclic nucleotide-binding domain-containing protein [Desulfobacterales bacterium]